MHIYNSVRTYIIINFEPKKYFENFRFKNFNFFLNIFIFFYRSMVNFILYKKTFIIKKYFNQKVLQKRL